ncbi:hypothetical protein [Yersinia aldovae]|uniref:hypothetical protein n=1 Tax=Yersinia aldovae TaxID=29483 RepID=UPI0011A29AC6|nr:hypothetical protein [Yersinia aldovae]
MYRLHTTECRFYTLQRSQATIAFFTGGFGGGTLYSRVTSSPLCSFLPVEAIRTAPATEEAA